MSIRGFEKRGAMVRGVAALCCGLLSSGDAMLLAQTPAAQTPAAQSPAAQTPAAQGATPKTGSSSAATAVKLTKDQLDSLVAPIALYPDPLLSQSLVASTYPLELVQAQQWLEKNKSLKGDAIAKAVEKEDWDPSVQATVVIPDLLKRLTEDITWTHNLGNAFLEQPDDVMDAVQRLRAKAKSAGKLDSTKEQKVETKVVENQSVIVIQPVSTTVVYVPTYSPTVIWGPPIYPYPPMYYPPYYAGAAWLGFGVGIAVGIGMSGGWGYGAGWGHGGNNVYINHNNNFNRNTNINGGNRVNSGNSNWQHNPSHRGGAPYSNTSTANKYGGNTRGGSASRQGASRATGANATSATGANRGGASAAGANRASGGGASSGGDRVGSRSVPSTSSRSGSGFSGTSGGASGASRASGSSSRGGSSMGGSRGGGGGGGGRRR